MIDEALKFLVSEVNAYLFARTGSKGGNVVAGRFVEVNGQPSIAENTIGVTLVNVDEERTLKAQVPDITMVNGRQIVLQPPIKLNLHLLFAANMKTYLLGLHQLGWVITFFQSHPAFNRDAYATLPPRIEKLTAELQSLTFEQLNQVWGFVGSKHYPCVMYRVRLVMMQDLEPSSIERPIRKIEGTLHGV